MAKKVKETSSTNPKVGNSVDPVKTRNLLRLISTLALLLSIAAFLLQLFAVLTHHWKWQSTSLRPLVSPGYHYTQPDIHNDSQLYQQYGLYSRDVKVYADNDEQVNLRTSTRFPRVDDGEDNLNYCLSRTSTLRGAFLTCNSRLNSPEQCHCRRYPYWNWVIFFEVTALILLGLVVFLVALQSTDLGSKLRPVAAGLAFLAFLFLLIGLLLIVTHLKRETRSFADAYPHINQRVTDQLGLARNNQNNLQQAAYNNQYRSQQAAYNNQYRAQQAAYNHPLRRAIRRREPEHYRAYQLSPGQHPYNDTHYQEFSRELNAWVHRPYAGLRQAAAAYAAPLQRQSGARYNASAAAPVRSRYGTVLGYDQVYDATRAGIGWSTVLSILATLLSLVLPLLLAFALLTQKKLATVPKTTTTTTTVRQEYTAVPLNPPTDTSVVRTIPSGYDPQRPIGEAIVTTQNIPYAQRSTTGNESQVVRDVVIPGKEPSVTQTSHQTSSPSRTETSQTTHQTSSTARTETPQYTNTQENA